MEDEPQSPVQPLEAELKLLRWHRLANESALQAAIAVKEDSINAAIQHSEKLLHDVAPLLDSDDEEDLLRRRPNPSSPAVEAATAIGIRLAC